MKSEPGTITKWYDEKGFGFITPKSGGKPIFVHMNEFSREHKRPILGLPVTYSPSTDSRGRICATGVYPLKGHKKITKADKQLLLSIIFSSTFFATIGILVGTDRLSIAFLGAYVFFSVVAFYLYKKDKSAAERNEWRTPEISLHFISLIGGWPGALIAQNKLRHKSKKLSFKLIYWATVIINCGALAWLFTSDRETVLKVFIANLIG